MIYALSNLDSGRLEAVKALESELGSNVLAFSGVRVEDVDLPDDKLARLQKLEQELGVVLVAVKPTE